MNIVKQKAHSQVIQVIQEGRGDDKIFLFTNLPVFWGGNPVPTLFFLPEFGNLGLINLGYLNHGKFKESLFFERMHYKESGIIWLDFFGVHKDSFSEEVFDQAKLELQLFAQSSS